MMIGRLLRSPFSRRSALSIALLSTLLFFGCQEGASAGGSAIGSKPELKLPSLDGKPVSVKDFRGKVVVVDFWATWCAPCHVQARILESLHGDYKDRVQFLAVDVGEDEKTVRRFVQRRPFPYPVLLDPKDELSAKLGILALPTLMILDKEGKVSFFQAGISDARTLREALQKAGA